MRKLLFLFAAVMAWIVPANAGTVTDDITAAALGVTGTNSYGDYSGVSISSAAVYSANCAKNSAGSIQLRSKNNSGIVSTVSGGTLKTVTITWDDTTAAERTVQVYGNTTAYTAPSDLYGNSKGTLIKEVCIDDATDGVSVITVSDEYEYVGIRSKSSALYLKSIAIEWETSAGPVVAKPTFSPAAGEVKPGTEVTLACATEDASIYYTTDGTEPTDASTAYTAPIVIEDEVTIKAIAYVGTDASQVATATYTVLPVIEDLNALSDAENGAKFIVGTDLSVVYANGQYNYVYDGVSYGLIYKNIEATAGQNIEAGWTAKMSIYNNLPEIVPLEDVTLADGGIIPEPTEVLADDAAQTLQVNNVNRFFCLMDVAIADFGDVDTKTFTGDMEGTEVTFYKRFEGVEYPEPGNYNVYGFLSIFGSTIQFFPTEFISTVVSIDSFNALSDIPDGTYVKVDMPLTVVDPSMEEAVIAWDGQRYGAIYVEDVKLKAGDVLASGWDAEVYALELLALEPDSVEIREDGTVPATPEFTAADFANSQYTWSYATLLNVTVDEAVEGWDAGEGVATDGDVEANVVFLNYTDVEEGAYTIEPGTYNMTGFWIESEVFFGGEPQRFKLRKEVDWENLPKYMFYVLNVEPNMPVIESLTAVSDIENNMQVKVGMPLTVADVTDVVTIVSDGQVFGAIAYYGAQELKPGDVIEAGWIANVYEGALMAGGEITLGEPTEVPAPIVITGDDMAQSMYPWSYLTIQNVMLSEDFVGQGMAYAYTQVGDEVPFTAISFNEDTIEAGDYNFTGFWLPMEFMMGMSDSEDGEVEPNADYLFVITGYEPADNAPVVENLTALSDFESMQHFIVGCPLTCIYYIEGAGVFTDGVSNIMLNVDGDYKPGDVLATGWTAIYNGPGLLGCICMSDEGPAVVEKGEAPDPAECTAEDIANQQSKELNYVKLMNAFAYDEDVEMSKESDGEDLYVYVGGNKDIMVYVNNLFGVEMPAEEGRYDIVGFWASGDEMERPMDLDDENESDVFYFLIPVSFERLSGTDIENIEINGNATYYDLSGLRVANPGAGKAYIRVINGKAIKIVK